MAKTETYKVHHKCDCGATGYFVFEENENPVHHGGNLDTRLVEISGPFKRASNAAPIECLKCGSGKINA